jgi:biotin operon repressor
MFGWFFRKKEVEQIREDTKRGFESVKKDIASVSGWIKHLDSEKNLHQKELEDIKENLSSIKQEIEGIKNVISFIGETKTNRVFKTPKQVFKQQTGVYAVQTGVQTGVQTPKLDQFSVTERAILWVLLNTDMKLSYDDLAAMLGKERSTIRGQVNRIRGKSRGIEIIEEVIEQNGKKRVFIPENIKEKILKKTKVRIKKKEKPEKKKKNKVSNY